MYSFLPRLCSDILDAILDARGGRHARVVLGMSEVD
jgi:hypothetical protein